MCTEDIRRGGIVLENTTACGFDPAAFTLADFETTAPYEALCAVGDPFQRERLRHALADRAEEVGYKYFTPMLRQYRQSLKAMAAGGEARAGLSDFTGQTAALDVGPWLADDDGVRKPSGEVACAHPIEPAGLLRNLDTGGLKVSS